ncbi:MAG: hypothetical protein ACREPN_04090 [Rudaea sp.]
MPRTKKFSNDGSARSGVTRCLAVASALAMLFNTLLAGAATISPGYSGMWFDPARSGEGLQLDILDANTAVTYWYTYDEHGAQRWLIGVGQIVRNPAGDSIQFPQMQVTRGGKFGPAFNPDDVQFQTVGNVSLTFSDCNTGTFQYDAFGQSQTLPIQRLTDVMGAGCTPINGVPGLPILAYAGQSGNWFDVSHSGEGFDLQWMSNNQAIVSWFTYDTSGNQVWLMGVGAEQNGAIVFPQMFSTSGPKFGTAFDPASYQEEEWGTLTLTLDCNQGSAHYASSQPGFGTGDLTLTRLTQLQKPVCPYVKPKLSDLYDITWNEIPIPTYTLPNPNTISAQSIAEDGTIAGQWEEGLALWHPDSQTWEEVPRQLAALPVFISPDGSSVIATDYFSADQIAAGDPLHVLLWQQTSVWQPLPGDVVNESWHTGVSHNFNYAIGYGRNGPKDGDSPWVRATNGLQQLLPLTTAIPGGYPYAVSDDGNTVVGVSLRFVNTYPYPVAIRWNNGGQPSIMQNPAGQELAAAAACNADCSIVYGAGLYNRDPNNPQTLEAWYSKNDGTFDYMGTLSDALDYGVGGTTPNGSIVVGVYDADPPTSNYPAATVSRAFIWTEATGIVSVRSLTSELGIGDDDWDEILAESISPDGLKILLGGTRRLDIYPLGQPRAVVLELVPKAVSN